MKTPEISVVIPVYNTGKILYETIESVLNQTFTDFEIVIIDDGSSDAETLGVLDSQSDDRIRIIHQKNSGVAAARNRGVAESKGNFIAFLDHDDIFLPEKLAECKKFTDQNPQAAMVYCDIIPFGKFSENIIHLPYADKLDVETVFKRNLIYSMSCVMVQRNFLEMYHIAFDPLCVPCDDWDFYWQCALRGGIYSIGRPLIKYRLHSGNQSGDLSKMYQAGIQTILKHLRLVGEAAQITGLSKRKLRRAAYWALSEHHYGIAFLYFGRKNIKAMLKHCAKAFFYRPEKVPLSLWKKLKRKFFHN